MTATELSPDELIRSRAFFDAAEFAEIVEHADDEIPCVTCANGAEWSVSKRCCTHGWLACPDHHALWVRRVTEALGKRVRCKRCGDTHVCSFDNFRVVPL